MLTWILVLTVGSQYLRGVSVATVAVPYMEQAQCESAGERWKSEATKGETRPLYFCIPGPPRT
jgi:hypothetical protein